MVKRTLGRIEFETAVNRLAAALEEQGELFGSDNDVIVLCSACGREIVAQHFTPGHVESEYRDAKGRRWAGLDLSADYLGIARERTRQMGFKWAVT